MLKKVISLVVCLAVMLSFCSICASADISGAKYSYTKSVSAKLLRTGTTLEGQTDVKGYTGITTKIEIDQYLEILACLCWRKCKSYY